MTAALGVIHDLESGQQKIYGGRQVEMTQKGVPGSD